MIYLDNNATTKPFPEVVEVMTKFMTSRFWNASSAYGQLDGLEEVVETAKAAIRALIGAAPDDEVVFTSGATESNAWAVAEGARRSSDSGWVLTSQIEHPSVGESFESLQEQGVDVRWLQVTRDGVFDLNELAALVDSKLRFASLMFAHNETGVIQPLHEATSLIRERAPQCLIHTDATQAIGKIPIYFADELGEVDLISFSCHKFHGPKGIGGVVIRNGVKLKPLIRGGGQQNNLRSGTLNIPAIAGTSIAAERSGLFLQNLDRQNIQMVRDHFEEELRGRFNKVIILGANVPRLPNTTFFGIPGTDSDDLVNALATEGIILSKGSSCSALSVIPSKTALAMGYSYEEADSLMRFSASLETTINHVEATIKLLSKVIVG